MNTLLKMLFSVTSMMFWGGAYTIFAIEYVYRKYWAVALIVIAAFITGVLL